MYGTLLKRAFGRDDVTGEKIARWFAGITSSAHRLHNLIDHLAQYSRLGSEQRPYAPTDIRLLLTEVLQDFSSQIAATGTRIETGALPEITCDAVQMRQVLQNLISNAIKYRHPDRSLVIGFSATQHDIPGPGKDGPMLVFTFRDNGIGFDDRYREQIFAPFERLHSAESYEGSGLGLAICRKVIERHGGKITAAGIKGEGSTFTITLPHRRTAGQEARAA
jgi:signal transduction histidine kinase